jgi:hypothetical protein
LKGKLPLAANANRTTMMSECYTTLGRSAIAAADHPSRGIFHPLGAAFFSNASYPETLKVINESGVSIEEFALAGARDQFRFNITTGATDALPALSAQASQLVVTEVPRYIQLWNRDFAPISTTNYKVRGRLSAPARAELIPEQKGVPDSLTVSGEEWFKTNNFTVLPSLLVNPIALYGYGDIRVVPAVIIPQELEATYGH